MIKGNLDSIPVIWEKIRSVDWIEEVIHFECFNTAGPYFVGIDALLSRIGDVRDF